MTYFLLKQCVWLTPDTIRKTDGKQKHGFGKHRKTENGTVKTGKALNE